MSSDYESSVSSQASSESSFSSESLVSTLLIKKSNGLKKTSSHSKKENESIKSRTREKDQSVQTEESILTQKDTKTDKSLRSQAPEESLKRVKERVNTEHLLKRSSMQTPRIVIQKEVAQKEVAPKLSVPKYKKLGDVVKMYGDMSSELDKEYTETKLKYNNLKLTFKSSSDIKEKRKIYNDIKVHKEILEFIENKNKKILETLAETLERSKLE